MTKAEVMRAALHAEGCLGHAETDEPVFVLRAKDKVAAETVRDWARRALMVGTPEEKIEEAQEVANMMDVYRSAHGGGKIPD